MVKLLVVISRSGDNESVLTRMQCDHLFDGFRQFRRRVMKAARKRVNNALAVIILCTLSAIVHAGENDVLFDQHIRPILAKNCFHCHGPDENKRESDLRLDRETAFRSESGESGLVVAHSPDRSELFQRITATDPDLRMPPPESESQLSDEDIELVRRWIEQGATWKQHWAFVSPTKTDIPAYRIPTGEGIRSIPLSLSDSKLWGCHLQRQPTDGL